MRNIVKTRKDTFKIKDFHIEKYDAGSVIKKHTRITNTMGFIGIKQSKTGSYEAQISINYKRIHIGTYDTKEEAALAYDSYIDENNLSHTKNFES